MDIALDQGQMKIGRKLAIKLLNASKLTLSVGDGAGDGPGTDGEITEPLDKAMLASLADLVDEATAAFDRFDYARALERTETFFWSFCDDHLELVKNRAYDEAGTAATVSAQTALRLALATLLKLFAPIVPFVTEEVWSWWQQGSIHRSAWPDAAELRIRAGTNADPEALAVAADVIGAVRKAKSEARRSMRTPVTKVEVTDTEARLALLAQVASDIRAAGHVETLVTAPGRDLAVKVELAPEE
jgi:valyl-tRNA synthetase